MSLSSLSLTNCWLLSSKFRAEMVLYCLLHVVLYLIAMLTRPVILLSCWNLKTWRNMYGGESN
ncbi:hypothetical protein K445DRAFT_291118 [Daldinia sp. EC12]|nr:hypothetical protein F4774DRAFT_225470 [Daldinia eschscholtzii]OTB16440.1 hypothetical protein K445DRAFT_291118 [Daldinia sp. EC12]